MFKNYLKTAFRKFYLNKSYTLINTIGLSLGITCAIIMFLNIKYELSFDTYHSNKDQVYRVNTVWKNEGEIYKYGASQFPLGPAIRSHFSDLKVTTISYQAEGLFTVANDSRTLKRFQEKNGVAFVEPDFFEMFDVEWFQGQPSSLKEPYTIALCKRLADKFFPDEPVVGKTVILNNMDELKIIGITNDPPVNTDFPFTAMVSFATLKAAGRDRNLDNWGASQSFVNTYIRVQDTRDASEFNNRITALTKSFLNERQREKQSYEIQPLFDVHYNTETGSYTYTTSYTQLAVLGIIAFFLVIIACINFINLATAQALSRTKETGIRKALGAGRGQLIGQFICETFIVVLIAGIISFIACQFLIPEVNDAFQFKLNASAITDPAVGFYIIGLLVFITLGSGLYPALIVSRYQPALVLKDQSFSKKSGGDQFRKGLVAFQFIIAQAMIIGTLVVSRQMDLFQKTDLGYTKDAIITVPIPVRDKTKMETLRTELLKQPGIENISLGLTSASSGDHWTTPLTYAGEGSQLVEIVTDVRIGDEHYIPTYGITILAGRNINAGDTIREIVVNEEFVSKMGLTSVHEAVGKTVKLYGEKPVTIVGVTKNYNMSSLHEPIIPMFISPSVRRYRTMSVKMNMNNARETIENINHMWTKMYPEYVFEYAFLDDTIARFYEREQMISRLFFLFSFIAITISCLGLFGLITFMTNRRTKEIGIRKVLGASVVHILSMLGKEYIMLIMAAFIIASPLMYYVMNQWLGNFAYKITIGADIFIIALILTTIITLVTIGYRALRAATANPVKSLRYE